MDTKCIETAYGALDAQIQTVRPESDEDDSVVVCRPSSGRLGREIYSRRMGSVEPVFANIQSKGMRRFTLRGQKKVSAQWKLFTMVHNIPIRPDSSGKIDNGRRRGLQKLANWTVLAPRDGSRPSRHRARRNGLTGVGAVGPTVV
jgi:hypothetical protein